MRNTSQISIIILMKIKLTVQKRLVAFGILNGIKNFSLADWGILDEAKKTLSLSEEDKNNILNLNF